MNNPETSAAQDAASPMTPTMRPLPGPRAGWHGHGALAVPAVAALVALLGGVAGARCADDADPGGRTAGSAVTPTLGFFVKDAGGTFHPGRDGEVLHVGDQIEFVVATLPHAAAVVVGLDNDGGLEVYASEVKEALPTGAGVGQPRALSPPLVLHRQGSFRFFVVWGDDARALRQGALEAAHNLSTGVKAGVDVATVPTLPMWDESTPQASVHIQVR